MAKISRYWLVLDCESSMDRHVIDFGALLYDRKTSKVLNQCGLIINDFYSKEKLFYNSDGGLWGIKNLKKRELAYTNMLDNGDRMLASVAGLNKWLQKIGAVYGDNLTLTAYNITFDLNILSNSGVILPSVNTQCLWALACHFFASRKGYVKFCVKNKFFTPKLNMRTSAEIMYSYLIDNPDYVEPHTALEDCYIELEILKYILRQKKPLKSTAYDWRKWQLPIVIERLTT